MNDFVLQKYRDLGGILTDSFQYIRIYWKSLGKALLLLVLPFYLVSGILVGDAYSGFFTAVMENPNADPGTLFTANFLFGMLLLAFSSGALLTASLTHVQVARDHAEVQLSQITDRFGANFFKLFLIYIIIIIAIFFSAFLFLIPAIYIGVKLFLAPATSILEDLNPIDAISRSWNLTQGHWWFTFGVYLVMNIISTFMSYILIIPLSIVISFMGIMGADAESSMMSAMGVFYGLVIVIASLFSVLMLIAMCLHYFNLVERKEGTGLRQQIEELG
ncbi:hypothetical protein [Gracilimonas tropica]|uniref:hypothetical protein n=1 Tax=Gracilimonas tropica TaxID=454600 RepID=UPI0003745D22|nr:hypothetical protein [Gracilimonas tropica]